MSLNPTRVVELLFTGQEALGETEVRPVHSIPGVVAVETVAIPTPRPRGPPERLRV